jgi:hypothetical protein
MAQLDGNAKVVKMLINNDLQNNVNGSELVLSVVEVKDLFKYPGEAFRYIRQAQYRLSST